MNIQKCYLCNVSESMSLKDARDFNSQLSDAITQFDAIDIDVREVKSIDVSTLQLLVAAKTSAISQGRKVTLLSRRQSPFEATAVAAGLLGSQGESRTSDERFWTGEAAVEGELI